MREFFKGWRRKAGAATLGLAFVFMVGWMRSIVVNDEISVRKNRSISNHFISNRSRLAWKAVTIDEGIGGVFRFYFAKPAREVDFFRGSNVQWQWRKECCGFEFGRFIPIGFGFGTPIQGVASQWHEEIWIIPYWSIVMPLTLLSAFLLLSKPVKKTAEPRLMLLNNPRVPLQIAVDPSATEGT